MSEEARGHIADIALIALIILCVRSISALFGSINRTYSSLTISRNRPIKGFLQILTILIYATALILILSILLNKSPWAFLSGLGAMTAILLLVFRDTLLSFVAGIQLTSNDFIRVGDWIEMPQFGADGDVIDMALNAVTVQNFDKTITVIPTHKFLENSFKNWRGMEISGGRRIKRAINIDLNSVRFLENEEIESFKKFKLLKDYILQKENELKESNAKLSDDLKVNQRRLTNIGTFRAYLTNYLKNHPRISKDMTLLVRHLDPSPKGLPIEIYIFTATTNWSEYEGIQADIFDHVFAVAPEFGLRVFQEPTGADFQSLRQGGPQEGRP